MNSCPPLFYEEVISNEFGEVDFKLFIDKEKKKIHIYAVQKGTCMDYGTRLSAKIKEILPYKKAYIICYLESPDQLLPVKITLQKYTEPHLNQ